MAYQIPPRMVRKAAGYRNGRKPLLFRGAGVMLFLLFAWGLLCTVISYPLSQALGIPYGGNGNWLYWVIFVSPALVVPAVLYIRRRQSSKGNGDVASNAE